MRQRLAGVPGDFLAEPRFGTGDRSRCCVRPLLTGCVDLGVAILGIGGGCRGGRAVGVCVGGRIGRDGVGGGGLSGPSPPSGGSGFGWKFFMAAPSLDEGAIDREVLVPLPGYCRKMLCRAAPLRSIVVQGTAGQRTADSQGVTSRCARIATRNLRAMSVVGRRSRETVPVFRVHRGHPRQGRRCQNLQTSGT